MERRREVRPADAEEDAHGLADLCRECLVADERADGAVEHDVGRALIVGFVVVEILEPEIAGRALRVDVALHHVIFPVGGRQAVLRLDEDHAIHAVRDVHRHRRGRTVVNEETGVERGERELRRVSWRRERARRAAARAGHGVQIDVVRHARSRVIVEVQLDDVALAHADETAGGIAAECPERVFDAVGKPLGDLAHLEIHDDLRRVTPADGRRNIRRWHEHGELDRQIRRKRRATGFRDRGGLLGAQRSRRRTRGGEEESEGGAEPGGKQGMLIHASMALG